MQNTGFRENDCEQKRVPSAASSFAAASSATGRQLERKHVPSRRLLHLKLSDSMVHRCSSERIAEKKKKFSTTTQKWAHISFHFFGGACAGLGTLTSQNVDRHPKKHTRFTYHPRAPKKKQQLLRSGPIVPGQFCFFGFCWCLCRFGASSGLFVLLFLVPVQVW